MLKHIQEETPPSSLDLILHPPPQWGILGSRMGGVTGFRHNASLKMHLSCFMVRMKKMNIF